MAIASSALMNKLNFFKKHLILIKRIGGLLVAFMGLILMSNQLPTLTTFLIMYLNNKIERGIL